MKYIPSDCNDIETLIQHSDPELSALAMSLTVKLRPERAFDLLQKGFSGHCEMKAAACGMVCDLRFEALMYKVHQMVEDPDPYVSDSAKIALAKNRILLETGLSLF